MANEKEKDSEKKQEEAAAEKKKEQKEEEFNPTVVTEETISESSRRLPDEPVPESEKAKEKEAEEKKAKAAAESESKKKAEAAKKKEESATSKKEEEEKASAKGDEEELPESREDDPDGVKKRIDKFTRVNRAQARELAAEREERKKWEEYARIQDKKRLEELESGKKDSEKKGEKEAEKEDPEPVYDEEKYEDYSDWVKEHTAWTVKQTVKEELKAFREEWKKDRDKDREESKQAAVSKEVEAKIAKGREKYKDFDEVVGRELTVGPMKEAMMDNIYASDMAADLAYHIASNPDEAKRISSLTDEEGYPDPNAVAREIGKLEAKLFSSESKSDAEKSSETKESSKSKESEESTETKKASSAPEPIESLGGRETVMKTLESMSVDEYIKTMNKKEAASRGF